MSKKLTRWFVSSIKPVHVGYYETCWLRGVSENVDRYWDGVRWRHGPGRGVCSLQQFDWRGLAKKP